MREEPLWCPFLPIEVVFWSNWHKDRDYED
jgi:hypothetical protein